MALMSDNPRNATIVCREECVLMTLNADDYKAILLPLANKLEYVLTLCFSLSVSCFLFLALSVSRFVLAVSLFALN